MQIKDKELFDLITASIDDDKDLLLKLTPRYTPEDIVALAKATGRRILVALPGPFYKTRLSQDVLYTLTPASYAETDGIPVTFTDIRRLNADGTAEFLKERGYSALFLPFAECASVYEYGYRASYESIGYMRACAGRFQITALCAGLSDGKQILNTLGITDCVAMRANETLTVDAVKLSTENGRDDRLVAEVKKTPFVKTAVVCLTRRHAENAYRAMEKRGVKAALLHGGRTPEQNADAANAFEHDDVNVLVMTKHGLPSAPFLPAEKAIVCGLPVSEAHARRIASLCPEEKLTCFYTDEDVQLVEKLLPGAKDAMEIAAADYVSRRTEAFLRPRRLLRPGWSFP